MKILLDENIDIRVKHLFPEGIEVFTVKDMGWIGIKNGELMQLLSQYNFDYWIVVDKNIPYQHNTKDISFTIIVLNIFRNTLKSIQTILPKILGVISDPLEMRRIIVINET